MRRLIVLTPAFVLVAACGSAPIKQESLSERSIGPNGEHDSGAGGDSVPTR